MFCKKGFLTDYAPNWQFEHVACTMHQSRQHKHPIPPSLHITIIMGHEATRRALSLIECLWSVLGHSQTRKDPLHRAIAITMQTRKRTPVLEGDVRNHQNWLHWPFALARITIPRSR